MKVIVIYKQDGTVQGEPAIKPRPLAHDEAVLRKLGVTHICASVNVPGPRAVQQISYTRTAHVNAFAIDNDDWQAFRTKIVSLLGFELWVGAPLPVLNLGPDCEFSAEAIADDLQKSACSHTVLVRELIGRPARFYQVGTNVTQDFIPERVNFVLENDAILKIWYG